MLDKQEATVLVAIIEDYENQPFLVKVHGFK